VLLACLRSHNKKKPRGIFRKLTTKLQVRLGMAAGSWFGCSANTPTIRCGRAAYMAASWS
jgi:hypothetical protein